MKRDTRQSVVEAMRQRIPFSLVATKEVMVGAYDIYSQTKFAVMRGIKA